MHLRVDGEAAKEAMDLAKSEPYFERFPWRAHLTRTWKFPIIQAHKRWRETSRRMETSPESRSSMSFLQAARVLLRREWLIVAVVAVVASAIVLPGLGATSLWTDEAFTAFVGRNVLRTGKPLASDGVNQVTSFSDHRDIRDGIYIWQPWLPNYAAAAGMASLGTNSLGARFPFALAFVILVALSYPLFRRWGVGRSESLLATVLLLLCVPLLLHARQCRYYVLAPLFGLLAARSYSRCVSESRPGAALGLVVWSTLLFNSFFALLPLLWGAFALDVVRRRPSRRILAALSIAALAVLLLNLPVAAFCRIWGRQFGVQPGYSSLEVFGLYGLRYLLTVNVWFFPLVILAPVTAWRWREVFGACDSTENWAFLFIMICLIQIVGFALISDYPFTRYLIGMVPFLMLLGSWSLHRLSGGRLWLAWGLGCVVITTNLLHVLPNPVLRAAGLADAPWNVTGVDPRFVEPGKVGASIARGEVGVLTRARPGSPLLAYLRSFSDHPRGPIDAIVAYLNAEARPGDRVKIAYGDVPLMFHTSLAIVSASEVGPPAPEWLIPRRFSWMTMDATFKRETGRYAYESITLGVPDVQWNNRPDPLYHYWGPLDAKLGPPLRILRRIAGPGIPPA
jgi:hypothetical protein